MLNSKLCVNLEPALGLQTDSCKSSNMVEMYQLLINAAVTQWQAEAGTSG